MLLLKDVPRGTRFYGPQGLGLPVLVETDTYAELDMLGGAARGGGGGGGEGEGEGGAAAATSMPLVLKAVDGEAASTTGYSPFLAFDVLDMDMAVTSLLSQGWVVVKPSSEAVCDCHSFTRSLARSPTRLCHRDPTAVCWTGR